MSLVFSLAGSAMLVAMNLAQFIAFYTDAETGAILLPYAGKSRYQRCLETSLHRCECKKIWSSVTCVQATQLFSPCW